MEYSQKKFADAIKSRHEVLIHGMYAQVAVDSKNEEIFRRIGLNINDMFE
jgi:hypothetical protein